MDHLPGRQRRLDDVGDEMRSVVRLEHEASAPPSAGRGPPSPRSPSHHGTRLSPASRPAALEQALALALAHEQYLYCPDSVDQGTDTIGGLAATLLHSSYWFFWWD